jgi:uncharacterized protein (DUF1697 family)
VKTYIVLLRGVNVGGKNLLPMKELKAVLENFGFENVTTYIQSGNIILKSTNNPETDISALISSNFSFEPKILTLSKKVFDSAVLNNPYQGFEGKFVHFYFCKESPKVNFEKLKSVVSDTENYKLIGNVFYIHAPGGIARSKLIVNIEKCLGVAATGRNLNTVNKLTDILQNA